MLQYNQWFGLFLTIIDIPLMVTVIPLLIIKGRNTNVVQKRASMFLFVELCGMFICSMIFNAYLLGGDLELCYIKTFVSLTFALYALPLLLRCWIYCFRYYLTQERKHIKEDITSAADPSSPPSTPVMSSRGLLASSRPVSSTIDAPPTQYSPFVMRRLWLISPIFLRNFFIIALVLHLCLTIIDQINSAATGSPAYAPLSSGLCDLRHAAFQPMFLVLAGMYVAAFVVTAVFLRKSKDAYRIKDELFWLALNWMFIGVTYALTRFVKVKGVPLGLYLPGMFILSLGLLSSFFISGVHTYYLAWHEYRQDNETGSRDFLHDITHSTVFRNKFADFLCLQLSIENLLFWEDVQKYKACSPDLMQATATTIYNKYIKVGSAFEVNVSDTARQDVKDAILSSSPSSSPRRPTKANAGDVSPSSPSPSPPPLPARPLVEIFHAAEVEVYANLRFHSYPCYVAARRSPNSSSREGGGSSSISGSPHATAEEVQLYIRNATATGTAASSSSSSSDAAGEP
eukprot:TRINITY_DN8396_c0_g1_i2.p1 TRINITY_DN8396_c0_g1~~TRINITY_DN8396_c0_g1_i2.p1  ORF type:complete len:514 (+),score=90.62 TRINITY_DN8396_c0_g1_i2:124-1665(+)